MRPAEGSHDIFIIIDDVVRSEGDAETGEPFVVAGEGLVEAIADEGTKAVCVGDLPAETGAAPEEDGEASVVGSFDHRTGEGAEAMVPCEEGVIDVEENGQLVSGKQRSAPNARESRLCFFDQQTHDLGGGRFLGVVGDALAGG